jgi:hypothetical protein
VSFAFEYASLYLGPSIKNDILKVEIAHTAFRSYSCQFPCPVDLSVEMYHLGKTPARRLHPSWILLRTALILIVYLMISNYDVVRDTLIFGSSKEMHRVYKASYGRAGLLEKHLRCHFAPPPEVFHIVQLDEE